MMSLVDISDEMYVGALLRQLYFQLSTVLQNFIYLKYSNLNGLLKVNFSYNLEGKKGMYTQSKVCLQQNTVTLKSSAYLFFEMFFLETLSCP